MLRTRKMVFAIVVGMWFLAASRVAAEAGTLQAGAAKVEITPDANAVPRPFTSILDSLYARAILSGQRARSRGATQRGCGRDLERDHRQSLRRNLEAIQRSRRKHPDLGDARSQCHLRRPQAPRGRPCRTGEHSGESFEEKLVSGLEQAARQAHDKMQPAKIGYGEGKLYLNVNRDAINEKTRLWSQEPNLDYPSDKTLAVIKIESLSGQLIAVYMNYAMHANSLFLNGMVSGDFPGEAERYLERTYDKAVAIWTSGAAGDQNPLYWRADHVVEQARVRAIMEAEHVDLGTAIMHAMFIGNPAADKVPVDPGRNGAEHTTGEGYGTAHRGRNHPGHRPDPRHESAGEDRRSPAGTDLPGASQTRYWPRRSSRQIRRFPRPSSHQDRCAADRRHCTGQRECRTLQHDWPAGKGWLEVPRHHHGDAYERYGQLGVCADGRRVRALHLPGVGLIAQAGMRRERHCQRDKTA